MNTSTRVFLASLATIFVMLTAPEATYAYGGPGSIISGIGTLLAVLAAVFASLFGFLWFPLKRLFKKAAGNNAEADGQ